mmetsp:Transcript_50404/g.83517  ORF Transcript_50404/g.83517 Transcript_50404/m.83517 type:complete len:97 (-) Transcript_50404:104-394(-)
MPAPAGTQSSRQRRPAFNVAAKAFFEGALEQYRSGVPKGQLLQQILAMAQAPGMMESSRSEDWDLKTVKMALHNLDQRMKAVARKKRAANDVPATV